MAESTAGFARQMILASSERIAPGIRDFGPPASASETSTRMTGEPEDISPLARVVMSDV